MPSNEEVLFPRRISFKAKVANNPVLQLDHTDRVEGVEIEDYARHGVTGWTVRRLTGEQVLIVSKRTSANPYGSVLLLPNATSIPTRINQIEGSLWLHPKPKVDLSDLEDLCRLARASWEGAFRFIEEKRSDDASVRPGLRAPQMGALYGALAHWKVTEDVGTIVMPTGTGKTETMLALLAKERPERLLVIVPTSALRDQIAEKFLTFGILQQFGVIEERAQLPVVGKVEHRFSTADDASLFMRSCNVVIATMQVISQCDNNVQQALATGCTHLFIDEAHHTPAKTWNAFRERAREANRPILQFTATPFRRDGKHVGGKPIFTYPLRKAQEEGYFTPIKFISIWEYNRDLADDAIAERAVQALREDIEHSHDHILMARTNTIDRAKQVYNVYTALASDLEPLIIYSQQNASEKSDAINKLRARQSRIIVCVDMLGEGFDLPQLKVAALHDVHKSLAITIQFAGRFTRTATGISDATIIANAADADVEEALEDLFAKDSDWNIVLRQLNEGATTRQQRRSEFLEGFQNFSAGIPLQNIYPKMSTVVYKTTCDEWSPNAVDEILKTTDLLVTPTVNYEEHVLLYITREQTPVTWGQTKNVQDVVHNLYLLHWDSEQNLLFINSSNNKSHHLTLAETVVGGTVELIRGEVIYRCMYGMHRLILSNLGLLHLLSRATQFTMHVGSDIKEGLSRASVSNRKKSNLFSRGYEGGESITIGASYKGRVWSHRIAEDISEWVEWCQHIGTKLLDDTISTDTILEHAIIPEVIAERPSLVPLTIEWPPYFLERSDEAVHIEIGEKAVPFYETELEITSYSDVGPIRFRVTIEDAQVEYKVVFNENAVEYLPVDEAVAFISTSGQTATLTEWFQVDYPIITFEDTAKLEYNEIFRPKSDREPYNASNIDRWNWADTVLKKESQYKAHKNPPRLEHRPDSIQHHVIERLIEGYTVDYDVIFDDDGAGEIADIVALKGAGDNLLVHLFHLKYAKSDTAGVRVSDFYEVCGQAQKSVYWRGDVKRLFERIKLREMQRQKKHEVSRFAVGDLEKLDELRRRSRVLRPKFSIFIVQPGLQVEAVDTAVLDLLGATELYLRETFDVPLKVIANAA